MEQHGLLMEKSLVNNQSKPFVLFHNLSSLECCRGDIVIKKEADNDKVALITEGNKRPDSNADIRYINILAQFSKQALLHDFIPHPRFLE